MFAAQDKTKLLQSVAIYAAILGAYAWLSTPWLLPYSLQLFALVVVVYLLLKRGSQARFWHLSPRLLSMEMPVATLAFLILIGSTGNSTSWLYPLTYVHLFFLVMATPMGTAIMASMFILLFHYALIPTPNPTDLITLATLPIILVFFLFAKAQYLESVKDEIVLHRRQKEIRTLTAHDQHWQDFSQHFLLPKLEFLERLALYPTENKRTLLGQINLIKQEIMDTLKKT